MYCCKQPDKKSFRFCTTSIGTYALPTCPFYRQLALGGKWAKWNNNKLDQQPACMLDLSKLIIHSSRMRQKNKTFKKTHYYLSDLLKFRPYPLYIHCFGMYLTIAPILPTMYVLYFCSLSFWCLPLFLFSSFPVSIVSVTYYLSMLILVTYTTTRPMHVYTVLRPWVHV